MDYKEKLRLAKEALDSGSYDRETIEYILPELKESEDEKISREITEFILTHRIDEPNNIEDTNSWLAWLEKQAPKPKWSKEDERERKRVVGLLEGWLSTFKETCYAEDCKFGIEWLKSLKKRMEET